MDLSDPLYIGVAAAGTRPAAGIPATVSSAGRRVIDAFLAVFLTLCSAPLLASDWHEHADIARVAEASAARHLPPATGSRVVRAGRIDSRLRLPRCAQALVAKVPDSLARPRRVTATVRCPGPPSWRLHVPVFITETGLVVVTTTARQRGEVVQLSDLSLEERDLGTLRQGYATEPGIVAGKKLRRAIAPGDVVSPKNLFVEPVVKRGQRVTLTAGGAGMQVKMAGLAMADGAEGQRIPVRNLSSSREIEGVVRSAQTVEVLLR